jgi:hypothetical protein
MRTSARQLERLSEGLDRLGVRLQLGLPVSTVTGRSRCLKAVRPELVNDEQCLLHVALLCLDDRADRGRLQLIAVGGEAWRDDRSRVLVDHRLSEERAGEKIATRALLAERRSVGAIGDGSIEALARLRLDADHDRGLAAAARARKEVVLSPPAKVVELGLVLRPRVQLLGLGG